MRCCPDQHSIGELRHQPGARAQAGIRRHNTPVTTPDPHDRVSPLFSGLTVDDAIELAEMLTFIGNWLTGSDPAVAQWADSVNYLRYPVLVTFRPVRNPRAATHR